VEQSDMKVIVLAGGKTNLPGQLKDIPKSLIEIKGRPLLEYQLELLKKYKLNDIRLSLSFKAKEILRYLKKKDKKAKITGRKGKVAGIEYIIDSKPLGTGGAIRNATKDLKKDFMIMNGDVLTNINLSEYIKFYKKNISEPRSFVLPPIPKIPSVKIKTPLRKRVPYEEILGAMAVFYTQDTAELGLVKVKNDRMVEFTEKPDYQYSGYINAGFYILSPQVFQIKYYKSKKLNQPFAIEEMVFPELARKSQLLTYVHRGLWSDIGSEEGLRKAEERIVERLKEKE
jgi:NDP-sugar pyrophosphorylase family protein